MVRRWTEELESHVFAINSLTQPSTAESSKIKSGKNIRLSSGCIHIMTHDQAVREPLECDLLIVDEAHRAKSSKSRLGKQLLERRKFVRRVLILTATPFGISIEELKQMLRISGDESSFPPVRHFGKELALLYSDSTTIDASSSAMRLAKSAKTATEALSSVMIRHAVDDLRGERKWLGDFKDWEIDVPEATKDHLELLLRMDRVLRVMRGSGDKSLRLSSDPRFDVGWRHFDSQIKRLKTASKRHSGFRRTVVKKHLEQIAVLRGRVGKSHPKVDAVAAAVEKQVREGEKVVLFCDHHATAEELTLAINGRLPSALLARMPTKNLWKEAWELRLKPAVHDRGGRFGQVAMRTTFLEWLCSDSVRTQTWGWLKGISPSASASDLVKALSRCRGRHESAPETIGDAANALFVRLTSSKSSRSVLAGAAEDPDQLIVSGRVLGACDPSNGSDEYSLFSHNNQPDTLISIFNSPFGPDVVVTTDRLSEGIDLHRYCRHLVHFELDPSPIRTVQRNGRLRRIGSWAASTGEPIRIAYPAFRGTRDHRLVQIMKKRVDSFSLLLGGVHDITSVDDASNTQEKWRNEVISKAKAKLKRAGLGLRA